MMKKITDWMMCFVPFCMLFAIQLIIGIGCAVVSLLVFRKPVMDAMPVLTLAHLTTVAAGSIWYYLAYGRGNAGSHRHVFSVKTWIAVTAAAVSLQALIQAAFQILSNVAPAWIKAYSEMIEASGIGDLTVLSTIVTLMLAPIGEELVFRGLTYRYLKRAGACAIAANIIQAALFGVMHLQPLQIAYAFILGLMLGWLQEKYDSVYVPMAMHCIFNFFGTYGVSLLKNIENTFLLWIVLTGGGTVLLLLGMLAVKTDKRAA